MKEMRYKLIILVLLMAWMAIWTGVHAQVLNWEYENVFSDVQQSGARPDLYVSPNGDMHLSFWNPDVDQLFYAKRTFADGSVVIEPVDEDKPGGYASAIIVDDNGVVHIAYLENRVSVAYLRYATNASGSWVVEDVLPATSLGLYGFENAFPNYRQPSLDIVLSATGLPIVSFFDGDIFSSGQCLAFSVSAYNSYDLNLNVIARQTSGNWGFPVTLNIPFEEGGCLGLGDRHGEFCHFLPELVSDSLRLITSSYHNHQVVMFSADPTNLFNWSVRVIDSTQRFLPVSNVGIQSEWSEGFEYFDGTQTGDSVMNLIYGLSNLYGNGFGETRRRTFFYVRVKPDSVGLTGYTPFYADLNPPAFPAAPLSRDGNYRAMLSMVTPDSDHIMTFHYNVNSNEVVTHESADAGQTWLLDTLFDATTNAQLKSAVYGDSIFLFTYMAAKDYLQLSSRHVDGGPWYHRPGTRNENRGQFLSSRVNRVSGNDLMRMAYTEELSGRLMYAEGTFGGTWSSEPVDQPGLNPRFISLDEDADGDPTMAYAIDNPDRLRFAHKNGSVWDIQVIDFAAIPRDVVLKTIGDSVHVCYYDLAIGGLKYARGKTGTTNWVVEVLDTSSTITGQRPDMIVSQSGNLHVSYIDVASSQLRYARRSGGVWTFEDVTDPLLYSPSQNSIRLTTNELPKIAFRDAANNAIILSEQGSDSLWESEEVISDATSLMAVPLKLIVDSKDRPWILYNFSTVLDELRLLRRDSLLNWNLVSVTNNSAEIANTFDFHLVEQDFYIIGKQNAFQDQGIGVLYAPGGVTTRLDELLAEETLGLDVFPNPADKQVMIAFDLPRSATCRIEVLNLMGSQVALPLEGEVLSAGDIQWTFEASALSAGLYFIRLHIDNQTFSRKLMIRH